MVHFFRRIGSLFLVLQLLLSTPGGIALAQEISEGGVPILLAPEAGEATVIDPSTSNEPLDSAQESNSNEQGGLENQMPEEPLNPTNEPGVDENQNFDEEGGTQTLPIDSPQGDNSDAQEATGTFQENDSDEQESEGDQEVGENENVQNDINVQNVQDIEVPQVLELSEVLQLVEQGFLNKTLSRGDVATMNTFLRSLDIPDEMIREVLTRYPARDKRELKRSTLRTESAVIPPGLLKKSSSSVISTDSVPSSAPVEFVSDRILVKVSSRSVADQWIAESQSRGVEILVLQNDSQPLLRIDAVDSTSTVGLLQRYIQEPAVVYQGPDYVYHTEAVPNDSFYNSQWHHFNNGGTYSGFTGTAGEDIQSPDAWDIFTGNGNVIVAVIDTGVMFHHTDLQARMWDGSAACVDQDGAAISGGCPYHGYDFFDLDNNPNDESNHGTIVAGFIAAHGNNGTGVSGVNWNGKIMALKTGTADSGNLSSSAIVSSINFAVRNGAKIINMSFSAPVESPLITEAIVFARTNGVLVLAAAGNDSLNLDIPGQNSYPCETALDNILCIASTNMQGTLTFSGSAATSNYGQTSVDFAAPGSKILSTGPIQTDLYVNSFENGATDVNKFILSGGSGWGLKDTGTNKMLTTHTSGSYTNNESTFAESNQTFNLSSYQSGTLFFEMNCVTDTDLYAPDSPVDGVAIDFSHDGGVTYQEVTSFNGPMTTLRGDFDVGPNGMPLITIGLLNDDFVNQFRFRFHFFSNSTTTGAGCDIDEVKLRVTSGSAYFYASGTSFATPVTAGLASLIWEYDSALTYSQVKDLLIAGGEALPALTSTTVTGKRINSYRSLALMTDPAVLNLQGFLSDGGTEFFDGESVSTSGPFFSWTAPTGQGILSGYSYAIDGVPDAVVDTTSLSVPLAGLSQGAHTFQVFAVNDVGVTGTVSVLSFTVDTLAPDAPTLLAVNGNNIVNASNESASVFSGTSVEAALLDYTFSDGSSPDVTGSQSVAAGPFSLSNLDLSGLDDGTLSASVTLTDEAGNVSTPALFSVFKDIDIAVPTQLQLNGGIPINAAMASNVNLTFDTLEAGSALYTISNGINTNLSDTVAVTGGTTSTSINHTSLNDAVLNISVVFTDSAGNTASVVQTTLVKDTSVVSAAQVQLNGGVGVNAANAGATTLSFQAFESGSADYVISDGSLPDVTGSIGVAGAGIISVPNLNVSGLDDGSLTVSVTITDAVGNTAGVTTVSTPKDSQVSAATNVQLNGGVTILAVNQTAVNLTFATTEAGSAQYEISDGVHADVAGVVGVSGAGTTTVTGLNVSSLDDGTLTISVVFTDSVLNTAAAGTGSVQKDSEILAPTNVQLNGGVTINFAARNSVDLTFATTEAGSAAYSISDGSTTMDNTIAVSGAGTTTVTGLNVSSLNDGTLNLSVVLTDTPGNVSTSGSGTVGKDTTVSAATSVNLNGGAGVNSTTASNSSLVFDTLEAGSATYTISNGVASDVTGSTVVNGSGTTTVPGLNLSSFGDGSLNLSVVFTDSVNNAATAGLGSSQKDVVVDSAVNVQLNGGVTINASTATSVSLTFDTTETGSATYSISDGVNPALTGLVNVPSASTITVSSLNVAALNNGTLNLSVVFTDALGNVSAAGTGTVIKDSVIPQAPQNLFLNGGVTINSLAAGSVSLTGTVAEAGTLLYAVLDGVNPAVNGSQAVGAGAFTVSGLDLSVLNDGTLTVYVTLTDPAGNTSLDGNTTVQKDVVVQAAASVVLNNGSAVNATTQTGVDLTFQTNEAGSAQYTITDGTVSITNTVAVAGAGTTTVSTLDVSTLSDGTLNISVLFTDTAGNAAAAGTGTVAKDAEVPLAPQNVLLNGGVTILQSNQTSVTLTGTVGEAGTLEYQLSDGVNPALTGSLAVGVGAFSIPNINVSGLNDGTISVLAHVTDAAANLSADGVSNVLKDSQITSATNVQLNGGVTINASTSTSVTLAFDATEAGSADYVISDGSAPFVSGTVAVSGVGTTSLPGLNVSTLGDGTLNISVVFSDTAGNVSTAGNATILKDTLVLAPQNVSFNNQTVINASTAGAVTLTGDVAEAGTLSYVISDGSLSVSASPAVTGAFSFPGINVSGLADGSLLVTVTLTDAAGNVSSATQVNVQKDTVISSPTSLVIQSGQPITSSNETAVSVTFSVTETGTVDYDFTDGVDTVSGSQVIAAPGAQNISSIDVSSLAEGTLTLTLSFSDSALNIAGDVSDTVLKDTIANTPTGLVINGNQAITLSNQSLVGLRVTLTETGDFVYTFTDGVHTVTDTVNVSTPGVVTVSNIDLSSMNEGTIMADVTFTDDLGNVSLTVPGTIVKDTIVGSAAQVILNAGLPVAGASAQSVALTFVVSETGTANYSITDENNSIVSGTVPVGTVGLVTVTLNVSSLMNGLLIPSILFIDAAGNRSMAVQGAPIEKVDALPASTDGGRRRLLSLVEPVVSGGGGGSAIGGSVLSESISRSQEKVEEVLMEEEEWVLPFRDLSKKDKAYPAVLSLYKKGVVQGQGNSDRFDPRGVVDWAQALKMLLMVTERKLPARVSKSPFPDVEITAWFAPYFALAKSLGFVKGNPDGRVIPWQAMNRAEAVVLVNRILGMSPEVVSSSKFSDVETGVWFSDALHDAVDRGLLKTREVNGFLSADPTALITRAEFVMLVVGVWGEGGRN